MDLLYWVWLSNIKGIGPITARKLLNIFGTPEKIYNSTIDELEGRKDISKSVKENLMNSKSTVYAEKILSVCNKLGINILPINDELYPDEVKEFSKSPLLIYYRGNLRNNSLGVGIVGARRCTDYGKKVTIEAAEFLAGKGIPIISGMAKGIDSYAHTACIQNGGYTLAFLGNGVDICFPKEQFKLMNKIIENGAVISKYPPGTKPSKYNFPERNYLLSSWSKKLLIVEAGSKSGALITARFAMVQQKQVFAVPNDIYSFESAGTNNLISEGCNIYLRPSQLLDGQINESFINLNTEDKKIGNDKNLTSLESDIVKVTKITPKSIDEILQILNIDIKKLLEVISIMEIEEKIICTIGGKYKAV